MKSRTALSLCFLCLLAVLLAPLPSARAAKQVICPTTNKAALKPQTPLLRCPGASEASCCGQCGDVNRALYFLGANVTSVMTDILSVLSERQQFAASRYSICQAFKGREKCEIQIEQLLCAFSCDASAAPYLTFLDIPGASLATLNVCPKYASMLYNECNNLTFPLVTQAIFKQIAPDADTFVSSVITTIITHMMPDVNYLPSVAISSDGSACYNGAPPSLLPSTNLCCDNLAESNATCPADLLPAIKKPRLDTLVGRFISISNCSTGSVISDTPPPAPAPTSATGGSKSAAAAVPTLPFLGFVIASLGALALAVL